MTTAKIKLDTWHKNCVVVCASQGKVNSRFLEITLVDGGEPLNLKGTTILLYAEKPDKNVIFNNCKIEDAEKGIVSVGLTSQMSALSRKLDCEIHVINREKSTLKILGLQIRIMPCANSDNAVESTSEFTVLSNAIEQTLEIMDQYSEENIMGKIKSMDGAGSGLDADLLDGKHGSEYATKAQGAKADSAIQGVQGNGTTITPNANKVVNVTPSNIGAVPNTRKVNNKPLSSDITLTPSDVGAAASSHGNHVPTTQTANNKVFLRNDNSWQNVTPANIGAVPTTRKVNNKALSADITLSCADVGAASEQHRHSASDITSGTMPIERGGTNAGTATEALENLGGVPKARTVNNKALSNNISLTASDVGAATSAQGAKADSAIQGIKVNGTAVSPDANKTVNIDTTSINAATPEQGAKADSAIQGVQGNGTTITPNANKVVNVTPTNIGAVPTNRTINNKALSSNISLTASDIGAAASSHGNHVPATQTANNKVFLRNDNTWQTVTPTNIGAAASSHTHNYIASRGSEAASTGRNIKANGAYTYNTTTTAQGGPTTYSSIVGFGNGIGGSAEIGVEWAGNNPHCYVRSLRDVTNNWTAWKRLLRADELTISAGTWTPSLGAREGTAPGYTVYYRYGRYLRINSLVYITFHIKAKVTSVGSGYSTITGLPFTATNSMDGQGLALREMFGAITYSPGSANIADSTATINLQSTGGETAQQWKAGDVWVGFSGCYIKS